MLTDCDPMWVSAIKALPTVAIVLPWVLVRRWRGQFVLPAGSILALLTVGGLLGQFGGNVLLQWSLGIVGIALAVPLCMGAIILCSAVLGRIFVNEAVTSLALLSMIILVAAICSLSLGAEDAARAVLPRTISGWQLTAGVVGSCFAGFSYAVMGVVIRYAVAGRASVAATILTTSLVGLFALGGVSAWRVGWTAVAEFSDANWAALLLAGLCNFVAFISLTRALQLTTLIYVNALNASQVAMSALAGVVLFAEVPSPALAAGVVLTVVGLVVMPRSGHHGGPSDRCPNDPASDDGVQKERKRRSNSASSPSNHEENEETTSGAPESISGATNGLGTCSEPG